MAPAGGMPTGIKMSLICMIMDGDMGEITGEGGQTVRLLCWGSVGGDSWVVVESSRRLIPSVRISTENEPKMNPCKVNSWTVFSSTMPDGERAPLEYQGSCWLRGRISVLIWG